MQCCILWTQGKLVTSFVTLCSHFHTWHWSRRSTSFLHVRKNILSTDSIAHRPQLGYLCFQSMPLPRHVLCSRERTCGSNLVSCCALLWPAELRVAEKILGPEVMQDLYHLWAISCYLILVQALEPETTWECILCIGIFRPDLRQEVSVTAALVGTAVSMHGLLTGWH